MLSVVSLHASSASAESTEVLYPTGAPEGSLVRFSRSLADSDGRVTLRLEVENVTKEGSGNGREVVVDNLAIEEPLPSEALLRFAEARPSRGTVGWTRPELKPCRPFILDAAYGFVFSRWELSPGMQERMRTWIDRLPSEGRWTVVGFSDRVGTPAANRELSQRRAASARAFLLQAGLSRRRLGSTGLNDEALVTDEKDGQALNRRIELYPADYPRLVWRIQALRPGEKAFLELRLTPGPFHRPGLTERWFADGPCYAHTIDHSGTTPTQPRIETQIAVRQRTPFGPRSGPDDLSFCEPFEVLIDWKNHGQRSAKSVAFRVGLPPKLQVQVDETSPSRAALNGRQWLSWKLDALAAGASLSQRLQVGALSESLVGPLRGAAVSVPLEVNVGTPKGLRPRVATETTLDLVFQRPAIALEVSDLPSEIFPGEAINGRLVARNVGTLSVDDLVLVASLPPDARPIEGESESLRATAGAGRGRTAGDRGKGNAKAGEEGGAPRHVVGPPAARAVASAAATGNGTLAPAGDERRLSWSLGQLAPGSTASRSLRFRVVSNRARRKYPLAFFAYERRYGPPENNPCATEKMKVTRKVVALVPPRVNLSVPEEVIQLGDRVAFRAEVVNPNPIPQRYRVLGWLDAQIWERPKSGRLETLPSNAPENRPIRIEEGKDGILELGENDGRPFDLTLPPGGRAILEIEARALRLSEQALSATSGSLVSAFDLSGLLVSAQHILGLAKGEGRADLLIYR